MILDSKLLLEKFITVPQVNIRLFWVLLVAIVVFGVVQTFPRLNAGLMKDEAYSANVVALPLPEMLRSFDQDTGTPLHFFILKAWTNVFGESEAVLRSVSVIAFALTILIVGATAQRLADLQTGLAAAVLVATSSRFGLEVATFARPYAVMMLLTAAGGLLALCILDLIPNQDAKPVQNRANRELLFSLLFVVVSVLALLTQPLYLFFLAGVVCATIWVSRRAFFHFVFLSIISVVIFFLIWGPQFIRAMELPALSWLEVPDISSLGTAFNLWGDSRTLLIIAVVTVLLVARNQVAKILLSDRVVLVSGTIAFASVLIPFLITPLRLIFNEDKTSTIALPMVCILAALLLRRLSNTLILAAVLIVVVLFSMITLVSSINRNSPALESMQYIVQHAECGDVIIMGDLSISSVEYYFRRNHVSDCVHRETFPLSTAIHTGWIDTQGLMQDPEGLAAEAHTTVTRLVNDGTQSVWLLIKDEDYRTYPVTVMMKDALESRFDFTKKVDLQGQGFDSILFYTAR